jgi:hypothetical protein
MILRATPTFRLGSFADVEAILVPKLISATTQATDAVFQETQLLVPVETGELKASGSQAVAWEGHAVIGKIEYSAGHAAYQEFGTGERGEASGHGAPGISYTTSIAGQPGTPYLRPALDLKRSDVKAAFVEAGFTL